MTLLGVFALSMSLPVFSMSWNGNGSWNGRGSWNGNGSWNGRHILPEWKPGSHWYLPGYGWALGFAGGLAGLAILRCKHKKN
jgi:hypothetical protein